MASSSWCYGAAEWRTYWTHVQIIFKHWFHDEIRPGFIMWLWFCVNFVPLLSLMNYGQASFEIMTRIRQMAPLLYIINFSKLRFRVKNERTLISAKNRVDLSSISEVTSYITEWPRFFGPPCISFFSWSWWSPPDKRIFVHFEIKTFHGKTQTYINHFYSPKKQSRQIKFYVPYIVLDIIFVLLFFLFSC